MIQARSQRPGGFTIVELLVVIVVIGILAAVTIVCFTGISKKAITASLQSDLSTSAQRLKMYYTDNGQLSNFDGLLGQQLLSDAS